MSIRRRDYRRDCVSLARKLPRRPGGAAFRHRLQPVRLGVRNRPVEEFPRPDRPPALLTQPVAGRSDRRSDVSLEIASGVEPSAQIGRQAENRRGFVDHVAGLVPENVEHGLSISLARLGGGSEDP